MAVTIIALIAVVAVVFLAIRYIVKEKKKGKKCIGCPYAGECCKYKDLEKFADSISCK